MKRIATVLIAVLCCALALPGRAQTLPVPPELAQIGEIKSQAATSLGGILSSVQRRRITAIGQRAEHELNASFGDVSAANGPIAKIFSRQDLLALAGALSSGQAPAIREEQMARLAVFAGSIVQKAGPTWLARSSQVDALLSAHQRDQINALRNATFAKLPHFSLMGFDVFGALSDGSSPGGFLSDAGSFALLLSLPDVERFASAPRRQTQLP
ncbi:MAG: hypothetical protein M3M96_02315 [Candidatus Eremiobacteraeota bacterium]|nr:hypothetical protein [Candidatus Eremiobacteraeota bacterium]